MARISRHGRWNLKAIPMEAGVEWIWNANLHLVEALLDQDCILDMDPTVKPLYGHQDASSNFAETTNSLHKITSASQLRVEQRWQLIIYRAFRKYKLIYRLYPPLLGNQIMLPLA